MRTQARRLLEEAREEVAVLARRRDAITGELGQLSGVIQALAVTDEPAGSDQAVVDDPTSDHAPGTGLDVPLHEDEQDVPR